MIAIPDLDLIKQIEEAQKAEAEAKEKPRKVGRPKGSKDRQPRKRGNTIAIDSRTGMTVHNGTQTGSTIRHIGDERITAFVQYHIDMLQMRQGVDKKNVDDLYRRFMNYLSYCAENRILPNNMNAYFAIGIDKRDIYAWKNGGQTEAHRRFAEDVSQFFASIHEQGPVEGLINPISAMFWQKAHDGMVEASKVEVIQDNPLGEKASSEEILRKYQDVDLPE